jgi:phage tail-like protein
MFTSSNRTRRRSHFARRRETFPEVLTNARFYVELTLAGSTAADAYFMECKGLKYSHEVIEACEVTPDRWGRAQHGRIIRTKMPGTYKVANLTLKRGLMTHSTTLWRWIQTVQEGGWGSQRRDGALVVYEQGGIEGARFNFFRAFPVSYSYQGSTVSSGDLAIEELELAIEDFRREK